MIKVADSNVLQTDQLKNYLLKKNNRIALPDYVSMEAYKGDTLSSIFKSMCILSQHPHQVIILKGTQEICALSGRRSGLRRRMVDPRQTREFYFYCRLLEGAARGDIKTKTRLLNLGRSASEHLERMLTESEGLAEIFREVQGTYSISDLSRFRRGESWSDDFYRAIMANVMLMTRALFLRHPKRPKFPSLSEVGNTLIFRVSLCMHLLVLDWILVGSPSNVSSRKLRNDKVDMMIVAYGTFFDGLITNDKKMMHIYNQACAALNLMLPRHRSSDAGH